MSEKEGESGLVPRPLDVFLSKIEDEDNETKLNQAEEADSNSIDEIESVLIDVATKDSSRDKKKTSPPVVVRLILLTARLVCCCFRLCRCCAAKKKIEPDVTSDPEDWIYEGPLESHANVLRGLLNPRDALTVFNAIHAKLLGRWHAMTHKHDDKNPIMIPMSSLVRHLGERATNILSRLITGGADKLFELNLVDFTVFTCRFSLMSPTSLALLLFRAAASSEEDFVSETSLAIEPLQDLLETLRRCEPVSAAISLRMSSRRRSTERNAHAQRRETQKLRRLASHRDKGDLVYLVDFRVYLREHPIILQPLMSIQRRVWNLFVGPAFWARVRRDFEKLGSVAVAQEAEKRWRFECKTCKKQFKTRKKLRRHRKRGRCVAANSADSDENDDAKQSASISEFTSSPRSPKSPKRKKSSSMIERRVSAHMRARRLERMSRKKQKEITDRRIEESRKASERDKPGSDTDARTFAYPSNETTSCVICLEDVHLTQALLLGSCGHIFHSDCISKWLDNCKTLGTPQTCALCRAEWKTQDKSPGLSMAVAHAMYKVPEPLVRVQQPTSNDLDLGRGTENGRSDDTSRDAEAVRDAWRWRHERTLQATARRENREDVAIDSGDAGWERHVDTSGAVYWYEPLTSRFRWDEDEGDADDDNATASASKEPGWVSYADSEGRSFAYNSESGAYRWGR